MPALRIMIVEDDPVLSGLLAELLGAMGHSVCATEATEAGAAAAAAASLPDLILVDVRLSEGSGVAAMSAILRARTVAHVYVTGAALSPEGLAPGAVVLRKPFSEALLARAIDRARARGGATED
jgi:CheY-like chemotaxis protein